jgi:hypothetical protein
MGELGHPKRLGRFKICGAAPHPYIVQTPFIEALQLVARAGTIPPFCKLPLYLVPARIAVDVNCEMQTDRLHRTLHPGEYRPLVRDYNAFNQIRT